MIVPSNGVVDENAHKIHTLKPAWLKDFKYLRLETFGQVKATARILGDVQGRDADRPLDKVAELDIKRNEAFLASIMHVGQEYRKLKERKQSAKTFPIAAFIPWRVEDSSQRAIQDVPGNSPMASQVFLRG